MINQSKLSNGSDRWLEIAKGEVGQAEIIGSKDNPRILEYHQSTTLKAKHEDVPWCAAFMSWVLEKAGMKSLHSAWAKSYLDYGKKLEKPEYGCICVFARGNGYGHVGFYVGEDAHNYLILGGNQGDKVCVKPYAKDHILGFRWPEPVA